MHAAQELNAVQDVDKEENRKRKPIEIHGVVSGDRHFLHNNKYQVIFVLDDEI